MQQFFTPEMCQHLTSLVPGFEGHHMYSPTGGLYCREMRYPCPDGVYRIVSKATSCIPAWQVEDVLRHLPLLRPKKLVNHEKILNEIVKEIFKILSSNSDTAYQKIEEYLWSVLK